MTSVASTDMVARLPVVAEGEERDLGVVPGVRRDWLWLMILSLIGLALRLQLVQRMQFSIDSDEAIVGLMAKHMLEGRGIPVFYYGQHYMGSLEAILVAVAFSLFGISSVVLRAVPLVISLTLIPLVYALGREAAGRRAGLIAAMVCACPPAALVEWSTKPRGGFIEIVWLTAWCLFLALRWTRSGMPLVRHSLFMGLLLGFGWWTNNQIVFAMASIGLLWMTCVVRSGGRLLVVLGRACLHAGVGLGGFIIGGAPFWIYNIQHKFASFGMFGPSASPWSNAGGLLGVGLPIIVGAKRFWSTFEVFPGSSLVGLGLYGWVVTRLFCRDVTAEVGANRWGLPILFVIATCCIFSLSSFGWLYTAPRYLLPLYPVLFVVVGMGLARAGQRERVAGVALFLAFNLSSSVLGGWPLPGEPFVYKDERVARNHTELIRWLEDHHVTWVRTNYWIGYRLAFETEERVRFLVLGRPHETRIPEYQAAGTQVPTETVPYVVTPKQAIAIEQSLHTLGVSYQRSEVGAYVILHEVSNPLQGMKPIPAERLVVHASVHQDVASKVIDGLLDTRWGSGQPQHRGMEFRIEALDGAIIKGVGIHEGSWWTDYPRGLSVECWAGDASRVLISPTDYEALRYHLATDSLEFAVRGEPCSRVVLKQTGSDTFFDWSIAELTVFQGE